MEQTPAPRPPSSQGSRGRKGKKRVSQDFKVLSEGGLSGHIDGEDTLAREEEEEAKRREQEALRKKVRGDEV